MHWSWCNEASSLSLQCLLNPLFLKIVTKSSDRYLAFDCNIHFLLSKLVPYLPLADPETLGLSRALPHLYLFIPDPSSTACIYLYKILVLLHVILAWKSVAVLYTLLFDFTVVVMELHCFLVFCHKPIPSSDFWRLLYKSEEDRPTKSCLQAFFNFKTGREVMIICFPLFEMPHRFGDLLSINYSHAHAVPFTLCSL